MPEPKLTAEQITQALGLQPLPLEGGLFHQSYRSEEMVPETALPQRYTDRDKSFCTAIYYLLTDQPDSFSAMHRLQTDEVFHFYLGDPLEITLLYPGGEIREVILGRSILQGEWVQFTVPRGVWQGARVRPGGQYSLIGTTMAPGYTDSDFELGSREELLAQYPAAAEQITRLTR
jgi:uncharacterized protein